MKNILLLFLLITSFNLNAQPKDTIFLKREIRDTPYLFYHAIFIDTSTKEKQRLTDFRFNEFGSVTYSDELNRLMPLQKHRLLNNFPKKWIGLNLYKGKYYLYSPSDFGDIFRFEITDSTTIDFSMEGPQPSRINNVSYITPSHIVIFRTNYWKDRTVEINIIDKEKGIAIFKIGQTKYSKDPQYYLMVDAIKAYLFPLINNYCVTDKQPEFEFDKIDFNKLLKRN